MSIMNRVEKAPACLVINLAESEKDIYSGAGLKLARFVDNQLVELFDPMDHVYSDDSQVAANEAAASIMNWVNESAGELVSVMCSCYQFCDPVLITPETLPTLLRKVGEQIADTW